MTPHRVLLPPAGILLFTLWCVRSQPQKKLIMGSVSTLMVAYLLLISPIGAAATTKGLTAFLPADVGQPSDAIVVLGRGPLAERERAQLAANLWQDQRAPVILTTGRGEAPRLSELLSKLGVPANAQLVESKARTTEENAVRSFELLQTLGAKRIILVTDQPHMLRSVLTFRSFGFETVPYPVKVPASLPSIEKTALALREYVGLVSYALIGRFQPRATSVAMLHQPMENLEV